MTKLFTLCLSILMGTGVAVAQDDCVLDFVDADGNVVEDGTTWNVYETEEDIFLGTVINSGLYVRNNSSDAVMAGVTYDVTQMSGGSYQICFAGQCVSVTKTGSNTTPTGPLAGGEVSDLESEWIVRGWAETEAITGTCTVVLRAFQLSDEAVTDTIFGPQITVVFHNDGTTSGIEGVASSDAVKPVEYYTLSGRRIATPARGLNIVKYSDGTIRKVVVK